MSDLPGDWRSRMVEMIRGASPADGEMFGAMPGLSPEAQIEVYREQFRLRLGDALVEEIPGLQRWLGDALDPLVWGFFEAHPPASWTLNRVADGFADWLEAQGRPAVEIDLARLDHAVMKGFLAGEGRVPRPEELQAAMRGEVRLRLQPHVVLLRFRWSVQRWRGPALSDQEAPTPVEGDFPVAVFRVERKMRHLELEAGAWAVLDAISRGSTLEEALHAALSEVGDVQVLVGKLPGWFQLFTQRGLVELATSSS